MNDAIEEIEREIVFLNTKINSIKKGSLKPRIVRKNYIMFEYETKVKCTNCRRNVIK